MLPKFQVRIRTVNSRNIIYNARALSATRTTVAAACASVVFNCALARCSALVL